VLDGAPGIDGTTRIEGVLDRRGAPGIDATTRIEGVLDRRGAAGIDGTTWIDGGPGTGPPGRVLPLR
jgi:hypothetical protein